MAIYLGTFAAKIFLFEQIYYNFPMGTVVIRLSAKCRNTVGFNRNSLPTVGN